MSGLPRAVEEANKAAETALAGIGKDQNPVQEVQEVEHVEVIEDVETRVAPGSEADVKDEDAPKVEKESLMAKIDALEEDKAKKEHTSEVFEGRFKKEREELRDKLEEQDIALKDAEKKLQELESEKSHNDTKSLFDEDELDLVGEETVNAAKKISSAEVKRLEIKLLEKQKEFEEKLSAISQGTNENLTKSFGDSILSKLELSQEQFIKVDESKEFNSWLEQPDGYSGNSLETSLDVAMDLRDVNRTVGIMQEFLNTLEDPEQPGTVRPAEMPRTSAHVETPVMSQAGVPMTYKKLSELVAKKKISPANAEKRMAELDKQQEMMEGKY